MPRSVAPLLLALALGLAGCASDVGDDDVASVEVAGTDLQRALDWVAPSNYELDLEVQCVCPTSRYLVRVVDGEVEDATALDETGTPTDGPVLPGFATSIEELQRRLAAARDGDGRITDLEVAADGRPVLIGIDGSDRAADAAVIWRVRELRPG